MMIEQDAQLYAAARSIMHITGTHSSAFGWFSSAKFGDRWIILHQSPDGEMTVLDFDSEQKRDAHYQRMTVAARLADAGVTDEQFNDALHGFRLALAEHYGYGDQAMDPGWTIASQDGTRRIVLGWVVANADAIRSYTATVGQSWGEAGALFIHAWLGQGETFEDYAAGEAVDDLMLSAVRPTVGVFMGSEGLSLV